MINNEIFEQLKKDLNMTEKELKEVTKRIFNGILETLKTDQKVKIRKFGTFEVRVHKGRKGRNPKSGASIYIPKKKVVKLSFAKNFKEELQKT